MSHRAILSIRNAISFFKRIVTVWTSPSDKPRLPNDDVGELFNIFGNISDEVQRSIITWRVPVIDNDVSIFEKLSQEWSLNSGSPLTWRTRMYNPIYDLLSIFLIYKNCWDSNTLSCSIVRHCNLWNVVLFLVINNDDHRSSMPLNVAGYLDETAFFGIMLNQEDQSLFLTIGLFVFLL